MSISDLHARYDGPIPDAERDAALRSGRPNAELQAVVDQLIAATQWHGELKGRRDWGTLNWVDGVWPPASIADHAGLPAPSHADVMDAEAEASALYREAIRMIEAL